MRVPWILFVLISTVFGAPHRFRTSRYPVLLNDLSTLNSGDSNARQSYRSNHGRHRPVELGYNYGSNDCEEGTVLSYDGSCVKALINQNIYFYEIPGDESSEHEYTAVSNPEVNHNYVFIRAHGKSGRGKSVLVGPKQEKTSVFVVEIESDEDSSEIRQLKNKNSDEHETRFRDQFKRFKSKKSQDNHDAQLESEGGNDGKHAQDHKKQDGLDDETQTTGHIPTEVFGSSYGTDKFEGGHKSNEDFGASFGEFEVADHESGKENGHIESEGFKNHHESEDFTGDIEGEAGILEIDERVKNEQRKSEKSEGSHGEVAGLLNNDGDHEDTVQINDNGDGHGGDNSFVSSHGSAGGFISRHVSDEKFKNIQEQPDTIHVHSKTFGKQSNREPQEITKSSHGISGGFEGGHHGIPLEINEHKNEVKKNDGFHKNVATQEDIHGDATKIDGNVKEVIAGGFADGPKETELQNDEQAEADEFEGSFGGERKFDKSNTQFQVHELETENTEGRDEVGRFKFHNKHIGGFEASNKESESKHPNGSQGKETEFDELFSVAEELDSIHEVEVDTENDAGEESIHETEEDKEGVENNKREEVNDNEQKENEDRKAEGDVSGEEHEETSISKENKNFRHHSDRLELEDKSSPFGHFSHSDFHKNQRKSSKKQHSDNDKVINLSSSGESSDSSQISSSKNGSGKSNRGSSDQTFGSFFKDLSTFDTNGQNKHSFSNGEGGSYIKIYNGKIDDLPIVHVRLGDSLPNYKSVPTTV